jgi:hypothetical protein
MPLLGRVGIINAFWLKIIMAALMVLDHTRDFLPPQPQWFHIVSRVVAPVFCMLVAEGLVHTRNRNAYIMRMLMSGVVLVIGSMILMRIYGRPISNTILVSLGLSAAIVDRLEYVRQGNHRALNLVLAAGLFYVCLGFEGQFLCPVLVLMFYYLRERKLAMYGAYAAFCVLLFVLRVASWQQFMMIFAVIPMLLYNGRRGLDSHFSKYFFYVFYPAHIWILYLIAQYR